MRINISRLNKELTARGYELKSSKELKDYYTIIKDFNIACICIDKDNKLDFIVYFEPSKYCTKEMKDKINNMILEVLEVVQQCYIY